MNSWRLAGSVNLHYFQLIVKSRNDDHSLGANCDRHTRGEQQTVPPHTQVDQTSTLYGAFSRTSRLSFSAVVFENLAHSRLKQCEVTRVYDHRER